MIDLEELEKSREEIPYPFTSPKSHLNPDIGFKFTLTTLAPTLAFSPALRSHSHSEKAIHLRRQRIM
jgi:hypothetical protein